MIVDNPHEGVPKSLIAAYVEANGKRQYTGSLEQFVAVRYLLFRASFRGNKEPPSKRAWLQHMLDYEKQ